ncbi:unnamed protein product [Amoebophrya sp. A120]|nr:unnamed protein product [Amoebophrya sp. A120]|eukprot:GSA120T00015160001.1
MNHSIAPLLLQQKSGRQIMTPHLLPFDCLYPQDAVNALFKKLRTPSSSSSLGTGSGDKKGSAIAENFVRESSFFKSCCDTLPKSDTDSATTHGRLLLLRKCHDKICSTVNLHQTQTPDECALEAMLQYHSACLRYCYDVGFSSIAANFVCSLLAFLLRLSARGRSRLSDFSGDLPLQKEVLVAYRDGLLALYRDGILTAGESELVTTYAMRSLFKHYKLYQYVFAYAVDRKVFYVPSTIFWTFSMRARLSLQIERSQSIDFNLKYFAGDHYARYFSFSALYESEMTLEFFRADQLPASGPWEQLTGLPNPAAVHAANGYPAAASVAGQQDEVQVGEQDGGAGTEADLNAAGATPCGDNTGTSPLENARLERAIQRELSEIQRRSDKMLAFINETKENQPAGAAAKGTSDTSAQ